jgi:hypothetical protein
MGMYSLPLVLASVYSLVEYVLPQSHRMHFEDVRSLETETVFASSLGWTTPQNYSFRLWSQDTASLGYAQAEATNPIKSFTIGARDGTVRFSTILEIGGGDACLVIIYQPNILRIVRLHINNTKMVFDAQMTVVATTFCYHGSNIDKRIYFACMTNKGTVPFRLVVVTADLSDFNNAVLTEFEATPSDITTQEFNEDTIRIRTGLLSQYQVHAAIIFNGVSAAMAGTPLTTAQKDQMKIAYIINIPLKTAKREDMSGTLSSGVQGYSSPAVTIGATNYVTAFVTDYAFRSKGTDTVLYAMGIVDDTQSTVLQKHSVYRFGFVSSVLTVNAYETNCATSAYSGCTQNGGFTVNGAARRAERYLRYMQNQLSSQTGYIYIRGISYTASPQDSGVFLGRANINPNLNSDTYNDFSYDRIYRQPISTGIIRADNFEECFFYSQTLFVVSCSDSRVVTPTTGEVKSHTIFIHNRAEIHVAPSYQRYDMYPRSFQAIGGPLTLNGENFFLIHENSEIHYFASDRTNNTQNKRMSVVFYGAGMNIATPVYNLNWLHTDYNNLVSPNLIQNMQLVPSSPNTAPLTLTSSMAIYKLAPTPATTPTTVSLTAQLGQYIRLPIDPKIISNPLMTVTPDLTSPNTVDYIIVKDNPVDIIVGGSALPLAGLDVIHLGQFIATQSRAYATSTITLYNCSLASQTMSSSFRSDCTLIRAVPNVDGPLFKYFIYSPGYFTLIFRSSSTTTLMTYKDNTTTLNTVVLTVSLLDILHVANTTGPTLTLATVHRITSPIVTNQVRVYNLQLDGSQMVLLYSTDPTLSLAIIDLLHHPNSTSVVCLNRTQHGAATPPTTEKMHMIVTLSVPSTGGTTLMIDSSASFRRHIHRIDPYRSATAPTRMCLFSNDRAVFYTLGSPFVLYGTRLNNTQDMYSGAMSESAISIITSVICDRVNNLTIVIGKRSSGAVKSIIVVYDVNKMETDARMLLWADVNLSDMNVINAVVSFPYVHIGAFVAGSVQSGASRILTIGPPIVLTRLVSSTAVATFTSKINIGPPTLPAWASITYTSTVITDTSNLASTFTATPIPVTAPSPSKSIFPVDQSMQVPGHILTAELSADNMADLSMLTLTPPIQFERNLEDSPPSTSTTQGNLYVPADIKMKDNLTIVQYDSPQSTPPKSFFYVYNGTDTNTKIFSSTTGSLCVSFDFVYDRTANTIYLFAFCPNLMYYSFNNTNALNNYKEIPNAAVYTGKIAVTADTTYTKFFVTVATSSTTLVNLISIPSTATSFIANFQQTWPSGGRLLITRFKLYYPCLSMEQQLLDVQYRSC